MDLTLQSLEFEGEPTNDGDKLLTTLAPVRCARVGALRVRRGAQAVVPLGMQVGVRKGWKVVAEWTAQGKWAPEGGVAHLLETQMGEKPEWQKSNPGKEEARVASRKWLSRGKSECGFPRDTGHQQHADGHDDLGKSPSG